MSNSASPWYKGVGCRTTPGAMLWQLACLINTVKGGFLFVCPGDVLATSNSPPIVVLPILNWAWTIIPFFSFFVLPILFSSKLIQVTVIVRIGDLLLLPPLCSSWDIQVKVPFIKARPWATLLLGLIAHFCAWRICAWLHILGVIWILISILLVSRYRKEYRLGWSWCGVTELLSPFS
jgi:hypothetical protein